MAVSIKDIDQGPAKLTFGQQYKVRSAFIQEERQLLQQGVSPEELLRVLDRQEDFDAQMQERQMRRGFTQTPMIFGLKYAPLLSGSANKLHSYLEAAAGYDRKWYHSIRQIAKDTKMSTQTAQKAIDQLVKYGLLTTEVGARNRKTRKKGNLQIVAEQQNGQTQTISYGHEITWFQLNSKILWDENEEYLIATDYLAKNSTNAGYMNRSLDCYASTTEHDELSQKSPQSDKDPSFFCAKNTQKITTVPAPTVSKISTVDAQTVVKITTHNHIDQRESYLSENITRSDQVSSIDQNVKERSRMILRQAVEILPDAGAYYTHPRKLGQVQRDNEEGALILARELANEPDVFVAAIFRYMQNPWCEWNQNFTDYCRLNNKQTPIQLYHLTQNGCCVLKKIRKQMDREGIQTGLETPFPSQNAQTDDSYIQEAQNLLLEPENEQPVYEPTLLRTCPENAKEVEDQITVVDPIIEQNTDVACYSDYSEYDDALREEARCHVNLVGMNGQDAWDVFQRVQQVEPLFPIEVVEMEEGTWGITVHHRGQPHDVASIRDYEMVLNWVARDERQAERERKSRCKRVQQKQSGDDSYITWLKQKPGAGEDYKSRE